MNHAEQVNTGNTLRALDAEVAEKIMEFTRSPESPHPTDNRAIDGVLYHLPGFPWDTGQRNVVPHYSTDISAAMQVLEKIRETGLRTFIQDYPGAMPWTVTFKDIHNNSTEGAVGRTLQEAICLAALNATKLLQPYRSRPSLPSAT